MENGPESLPAAKLQKVAAVDTMEPTDLWADSDDSDFQENPVLAPNEGF